MQAAGNRAAHAGLFLGVECIQIHAHAKTGRAVPHDGQCFVEHRGQTAPADFIHIEYPYPQPVQQRGFACLKTAHADQAHVFGPQLGFRPVDSGQRRVAVAEQAGQRHAVNLPARRGGKGVAVHVGVDPDQADWALAGEGVMHAAPGADGAGMIAAHHQREMSRLQHRFHFCGQPGVERCDSMQWRVLLCARHAQDRIPCHVLQRRVVEDLVTAQCIRPLGAGRVGRTGPTGGADDHDAAGFGWGRRIHAVSLAGIELECWICSGSRAGLSDFSECRCTPVKLHPESVNAIRFVGFC